MSREKIVQMDADKKIYKSKHKEHKSILCTISQGNEISFPDNWHIIFISICLKFYILKLTRYISPRNNKIPVELIKAGQFNLWSISLSMLFGIKRNCVSSGWNHSLYLIIRRVIKQTEVMTQAYHSYQLHTKLNLTSFC